MARGRVFFSDTWNVKIANIEEIQHLRGLKYLQCLMLSDNPCVGSAPDKYRKTVIAMMPRLYK